MRSRQQIARESASGLIIALCLVHGDRASASDDPFALPYDALPTTSKSSFDDTVNDEADGTAPTEYKLFAEIRVNGVPRKRLVQLLDIDGQISILAQDAEAAGLTQSAHDDAYLSLDNLKLLKWHFDRISGILSVEVARKSDGPNNIDLARDREFTSDSQPLTAFITNYNVSTSISDNGLSAAGILESKLVRGDLALGSSVRFATNHSSRQPRFVRLDSALTLNIPTRAISATLGDFVSTGPASARHQARRFADRYRFRTASRSCHLSPA